MSVTRIAKSMVPVAFVFMTVACDKLLDLPNNPTYQMSATGGSPDTAPGGPWACLDADRHTPVPEEPSVEIRLRVCDFIMPNCAQRIQGVTAKLCNKLNVECATPIAEGLTDSGGELRVEVPTVGTAGSPGFDGYIEIEAPVARCTDEAAFGGAAGAVCALAPGCDQDDPDDPNCDLPIYPKSLFFFNPPVVVAGEYRVLIPPTYALPQFVEAGTEMNFNPGTGIIAVTALDCNGAPAAGVSFVTDRDGEGELSTLYLRNTVFRPAEETDGTGIMGIVSVPPGNINFTGILGDREVGSFGLYVEAFTMNFVDLGPFDRVL